MTAFAKSYRAAGAHVIEGWVQMEQSCDAIVKWDGAKFTYEPLLGSRNRRAR